MLAERSYRYLEERPHAWRKQLWIPGRNMTAWQLVESLLTNHDNPEDAAQHHALPLAVVAEALLYCLENRDLIEAEREQEWRWLREAGVVQAEE
jgi:hypothetical protein